MQKGFDVFFFDPGSKDDVFCRACHTKCEVRRNVYGATSSVMAMAKIKKLHDVFTCPYSGKEWHNQAVALAVEIDKTPSKAIAELMKNDLQDLINENIRTEKG